jgi:hypothetical protein
MESSMIGAIMGVGSGKSFSSVGMLSADRPLEISAFLMVTHPWQMVNHPRKIPYRFLLRIIKLSISIVDLDRVLNQFAILCNE